MKDPIHIALTHDDNYTEHAVVCIVSICENMQDDNIIFHILDGGLSDASKKSLLAISESYRNIKIEFDKMDNSIFKNYKKSDYYPVQILWTMILPEVHELSQLKRIIYLDCDMVVHKSLRPLWEMDFENNYILAVEDANGKKYSGRFLKNKEKFFNTGLMVINCDMWKRDDISLRAVKMAIDNTGTTLGYDQTVLNILFAGFVKYIGLEWNLQYSPMNVWPTYDDMDEYKNAIKNPNIIHYVGDYKPWVLGLGCFNPKQEDYMRYHKLTLYRKENYKKWLKLDRMQSYKGIFAFIKRYPFFFLKSKFWKNLFMKY